MRTETRARWRLRQTFLSAGRFATGTGGRRGWILLASPLGRRRGRRRGRRGVWKVKGSPLDVERRWGLKARRSDDRALRSGPAPGKDVSGSLRVIRGSQYLFLGGDSRCNLVDPLSGRSDNSSRAPWMSTRAGGMRKQRLGDLLRSSWELHLRMKVPVRQRRSPGYHVGVFEVSVATPTKLLPHMALG